MITYNPKDWFSFIFRFHKADTVRKLLPVIIGISVYSFVIAFIEIEYLKLSENSRLSNITVMHTTLGFVISMLLVFRINSAYDRWYEGRKLWGSLVNSSRNFSLKLRAMVPDDNDLSYFQLLVVNYAYALKNHLRDTFIPEEMKSHPDIDVAILKSATHVPNLLAEKIYHRIMSLYDGGIIKNEQLLLLDNELRQFTDICGGCERIKKTPIPFSYSSFLKKFIFFYVMALPVALAFSVGYMSVPLTAFLFYVLASLELIAEEIENPFGADPNDLPTESVCQTIEQSVAGILGEVPRDLEVALKRQDRL